MSNSNITVKLYGQGVRELLKSDEVLSELENHAKSIASEAGHSTVETAVFKRRSRARVVQQMDEKDLEDNTLLKAVH